MKRVLCVLLSLSLVVVLAADTRIDHTAIWERITDWQWKIVNIPQQKADSCFSREMGAEAEQAEALKAVQEYVEAFTFSYFTIDPLTLTTVFYLPALSNPKHNFDDFYSHPYEYLIFTTHEGEYANYMRFSKQEDGTFDFSSPYNAADELLEVMQDIDFENTILLMDWTNWYIWTREENGMERIRTVPRPGFPRETGQPWETVDIQTFLNAAVYRNKVCIVDGCWGEKEKIKNYMGKNPDSLSSGNTAFLIGTGIIFAVGTGIAVLLFVKRRKRRRQRNSQVK